jgi:hypothetical protein
MSRRSVWVVEYQDWGGSWHQQFVQPIAFHHQSGALKRIKELRLDLKEANAKVPLRAKRYDASTRGRAGARG